MRFQGLHDIVTGGGRGIGAVVSDQLRAEGGVVSVLNGSCDVTRPEEIAVDVLVRVAGRLMDGTSESISEDFWRCVRAALPLLRKSACAAIVTVPSYQAIRPGPGSEALP